MHPNAAPRTIDDLPWFWRFAIKDYFQFQHDIRCGVASAGLVHKDKKLA